MSAKVIGFKEEHYMGVGVGDEYPYSYVKYPKAEVRHILFLQTDKKLKVTFEIDEYVSETESRICREAIYNVEEIDNFLRDTDFDEALYDINIPFDVDRNDFIEHSDGVILNSVLFYTRDDGHEYVPRGLFRVHKELFKNRWAGTRDEFTPNRYVYWITELSKDKSEEEYIKQVMIRNTPNLTFLDCDGYSPGDQTAWTTATKYVKTPKSLPDTITQDVVIDLEEKFSYCDINDRLPHNVELIECDFLYELSRKNR